MPRDEPQRRYFKELRFQQLQGFCSVARERSFAKAAANLQLSRPAVWHQIRSLERELDSSLVRRRGRGIELTADGRLLLEMTEPLVTGFDAIKNAFVERKGELHDRLVLTSDAASLTCELKAPLQKYRQRYPDVHLTLLDRTSRQALQLIEEGRADLAVAGTFQDEPADPALEYETLASTGFVLICPTNHPLVRRRTVRLPDLVRFPFVLMAQESITRARVERVFRQHGLLDKLNVVVDTTNFSLLLNYVRLGWGISVVASEPSSLVGRRLHVRRLPPWFGRETMIMAWKKGAYLAPHMRAFQELVRHDMAQAK